MGKPHEESHINHFHRSKYVYGESERYFKEGG